MSYNAELNSNNAELQEILNTINELPDVSSIPGENGATFTPSVSSDGVLSWTNDKGLENPAPVNIKGKDGTSVTITNVSESTADGGSNVVTFSNGQSITIKNGSKGSAGKDGTNGTSVTVSNVSESTASGGSNVVTFSDGNKVTIKNGINGTNGKDGADGKDGTNGIDGKTPVKGTDYFTSADKTEMVNAVIAALPKYNGGVS